MLKRLLVAGLACLGLHSAQSRAVASPHETAERQSIAKNGQTTREIKEDHFGGFRDGIRRQWLRAPSRTPYEFGISKECAQMRRKNRMRGLGIKGSRI